MEKNWIPFRINQNVKKHPMQNFSSIGEGLEVAQWLFILVKESYGSK